MCMKMRLPFVKVHSTLILFQNLIFQKPLIILEIWLFHENFQHNFLQNHFNFYLIIFFINFSNQHLLPALIFTWLFMQIEPERAKYGSLIADFCMFRREMAFLTRWCWQNWDINKTLATVNKHEFNSKYMYRKKIVVKHKNFKTFE